MNEQTNSYPSVEEQLRDIISLCKGRKGLRSTRPVPATKDAPFETRILHNRAYFVWRLARFHGGKDVTMPVMATMNCYNDPYYDTLEKVSEMVAKQEFGTDMAAALRWRKALIG